MKVGSGSSCFRWHCSSRVELSQPRALSPHRRKGARSRSRSSPSARERSAGHTRSEIAGVQAAFSQYAGAKPKDKKKPSAGITGGRLGGKKINIVGYGCGDETPALALKETRRLMEQLGGEIMIGPLSGDEGVAVANYAKSAPEADVLQRLLGRSADDAQGARKELLPLQRRRCPVERRHGRDRLQAPRLAQRGDHHGRLQLRRTRRELASSPSSVRGAARSRSEFSCRSPNTDYSSYVQQLPSPDKVDGYFWVVGGSGTGPSLKAYQQAYGAINPKKFIGNLFFAFYGADKELAPQLVGAYMGGFGTGPGLQTKAAKAYRKMALKWYPDFSEFGEPLRTTAFSTTGGIPRGHSRSPWARSTATFRLAIRSSGPRCRGPQRRVRGYPARQEPAGDP